jgi:Beta-propeller repeat
MVSRMRVPVRRAALRLVLALLATLLPAGSAVHASLPARAVSQALQVVPRSLHAAAVDASSPPLGWTTYLAGMSKDESTSLAVDSQGNVYVTGRLTSAQFSASPGAAQPHYGGGDYEAFVASYTANGRPRWATFLGGAGDDFGDGIAVDGKGNVYVLGTTGSANFPVTAGAAQSHFAGGEYDVFITAYTVDGRRRWATLLGGIDSDEARGIAVDRQGNIYITGATRSSDFPVTAGAAQPHYGGSGNDDDAFVAAYTSDGRLRWATYLSGIREDFASGIALDGKGNLYLAGNTASADFPVTAGAAQPRLGGGLADAFVAAYSVDGRLRWATYLGGNDDEDGFGIAADHHGNLYVTGDTRSANFPVTVGAAQPHFGGAQDAYVASYAANGRMRWATYLGGTDKEYGLGIVLDSHDNLYVSGETSSSDFPVTVGPAQSHYGGNQDGFIVTFTATGVPGWATFLGGTSDDFASCIAIDRQGAVYVTGLTGSNDFPVTAGAALTVYDSGTYYAYIARLVVPASRPAALDPASPPPPGASHIRYFPQTHHALSGPFLAAWDQLGAIPTLGLPLSEPFTLAGQQIQATERVVLVHSGGTISLMPLGPLLSAARVFAPVAPAPNTASTLYFPSTGHALSGPFLHYWQAHQGSVLLGSPISEPDREGTGDGTGRVYQVQWFTNGRLELHPEIKDPRYQVEQGRVGYEYLHRLGLL